MCVVSVGRAPRITQCFTFITVFTEEGNAVGMMSVGWTWVRAHIRRPIREPTQGRNPTDVGCVLLRASIRTPPFPLMSPFTRGRICVGVAGVGRAPVIAWTSTVTV